MEFKTLIESIVKNGESYEKHFDVEIDMDFAAYSLIKEIGQFADSILLSRGNVKADKRVGDAEAKDRLTQELVDIVALAIINADVFDVDLEKGLVEKWIKKEF